MALWRMTGMPRLSTLRRNTAYSAAPDMPVSFMRWPRGAGLAASANGLTDSLPE